MSGGAALISGKLISNEATNTTTSPILLTLFQISFILTLSGDSEEKELLCTPTNILGKGTISVYKLAGVWRVARTILELLPKKLYVLLVNEPALLQCESSLSSRHNPAFRQSII